MFKKGIISQQQQPFIFTVKTDNAGTSNNDQFTMPLVSAGSYNAYVNWGDGSSIDHITAYNQSEVTHTFTGGAGTYEVKVYGRLTGWSFNNGGDKAKFLDILQKGIFDHNNEDGAFYGCSNLTSISATDKPLFSSTSTSVVSFFRDCSFTSLDWSIYNFTGIAYATNFLNGITLDQTNLDSLLANLQLNISSLENSVVIHLGSGVYSIGDSETTIYDLSKDKSWTISSGGCSIANQVMWLDAKDPSTITESSTIISEWDEKSLNENNISTGSATYDETTPAQPVSQYNGITDYFERDTPSQISNWTAARTFIAVVKVPATPLGYIWQTCALTSVFRDEQLYFNGSNQIEFMSEHSTAPSRTITGSQPSAGFHIFIVRIDTSANNRAVDFYQDGVLVGSSASMGSSSLDPNKLYLGVDEDGGGYQVKGDYTNSGLAELRIYDRFLTNDELTELNGELSTKWGI